MKAFDVPCPKRRTGNALPDWYAYYAGYTTEFVAHTLASLPIPAGSLVAAPWNGAGTTVWATLAAGFRAAGLDLNPAMTEVARGRMMPASDRENAARLAQQAVAASSPRITDDPLNTWFGTETASRLRSIAARVMREEDSLVRGFVLTALMRTAKPLAAPFASANPTWVKVPSGRRRSLPGESLAKRFMWEVEAQSTRPPETWIPPATEPTQSQGSSSRAQFRGRPCPCD